MTVPVPHPANTTATALSPGYPSQSWYSHSTPLPAAAAAPRGTLDYDAVVIGGGIAGLSTALHLAQRGRHVCVLEAHRVGWAASGRNGGQVLNGYACEMDILQRLLGEGASRRLWELSVDAVQLTRQLINHHHINCDLRDGMIYTAIKPRQVTALRQAQRETEQQYGYPHLQWLPREILATYINSPRYLAGLYDRHACHLHPLKYTLGLARAARQAGAVVYENSRARCWQQQAGQVTVFTDDATINARHLVFCGNTELNRSVPAIRNRIMPVGTYIAATEPVDEHRAQSLIPCGAAVCDTNFVLDYFRLSADHRLLFGGLVSYSGLRPWRLEARMQQRLLRVFPQLAGIRLEYAWGGNVDITMNRAPHFGRLHPHVYYAQGFSGHGLALAGLSGKLISDAIHGDSDDFDLFTRIPHRPFPGGRWLRTPLLAAAMAWYRFRDWW